MSLRCTTTSNQDGFREGVEMSDTGDIIRSGAFEKIADIVHKLAGPMADEIGSLMADKIKVYRVANWVKVVEKTRKILANAKLPPNAVPPRLFLPILEASSVEGDESLQELWAGLLATASEKADALSPSFIEALRQLTPAEARTLNHAFQQASTNDLVLTGFDSSRTAADVTTRLKFETFERLGLVRREYDIQERSMAFWFRPAVPRGAAPRGTFLTNAPSGKDELPELTYKLVFTEYGVQFMNSCRGPAIHNASS
jgi:hypothetical protein